MGQFSFEYPLALLLLLLFILCARVCAVRATRLYFPHLARLILPNQKVTHAFAWIKWLGIIAVVVALASPVLTKSYTHSKKEGRDIVLVIDSSNSMQERGFDPNDVTKNKFEVVKEVVAGFIDKRENDRIGVINFADISFIASPLTFEREFLRDIVSMQRLGVAGMKTALYDGVVQGYNLLHKSQAKSKIMILLTDGHDTISKTSFDEVEHLLKSQKIKLYAIGIGDPRAYNGAVLQALANAGGGEAFGARDATRLGAIYEEIDRLEATKIDNKRVVEYTYLYIYPLAFGIVMLLLWSILRSRRGL
jgi:Ca-activated chloride channel family protein